MTKDASYSNDPIAQYLLTYIYDGSAVGFDQHHRELAHRGPQFRRRCMY